MGDSDGFRVYAQGDPGNGMGGFDIADDRDQAFAFDYGWCRAMGFQSPARLRYYAKLFTARFGYLGRLSQSSCSG